MKTSNQFRMLSFRRILLPFIAVIVILSSCMKSDNDNVLAGEAKVMIVNAAAGSGAQDFYLDTIKVNTDAVAYSQSTAYVTTPAGGEKRAEFRNAGSAVANFFGYITIFPNEHYTFFYINNVNGTENSSTVFTDETVSPSPTKSRVRFVNLAGGYNSANLLIAGGENIAVNIAFGSGSAFRDVDPGTITLQTAQASNGGDSVNLGSFTLAAGKIYTIYTSGSLSTAVIGKTVTHN